MRQDRLHAVRRHAVWRHCSKSQLQQDDIAPGRTCSQADLQQANLQASGAARRTCSRPKLQQTQLAAGRHCSRAALQHGDIAAERICRLPERPEVGSARQGRRSEACRELAPSHATQVKPSHSVAYLFRYRLVLLNYLTT